MKFILSVVTVGSFIVGIFKVFYVMPKNCGIDFPIISLNNKGVPQLLQTHEILVFCPNLKLNADVPEAKRQFP